MTLPAVHGDLIRTTIRRMGRGMFIIPIRAEVCRTLGLKKGQTVCVEARRISDGVKIPAFVSSISGHGERGEHPLHVDIDPDAAMKAAVGGGQQIFFRLSILDVDEWFRRECDRPLCVWLRNYDGRTGGSGGTDLPEECK